VHQLDDELRHPVARGGLAAEDHAARYCRAARVAAQALPERDHVQHVQVLALVLVDALHLHVEQAVGIAGHAGAGLDHAGEIGLVGALRLPPLRAEGRVLGQRLELAQPLELAWPAVPDRLRDERGEARVGEHQEAPRRHAVRDVQELLRPQLVEVAQHVALQQLGVESGHAVDAVAAGAREVRHAHRARAVSSIRLSRATRASSPGSARAPRRGSGG
jgi:hypothetical protein